MHDYGLVIAHAIVNPNHKEVFVRVFNPYDSDVLVQKETNVALFLHVNYCALFNI